MDRTVLTIDSGMSWLQFQRSRGEISRGFLARAVWWSLQYKLALLDVETLVTRLASDYEGDAEDEMIAKCEVWYEAYVADKVAPAARSAIDAHRAAGDEVVLLTGATQYVAEVVARSLGIEHTLCTRVEVDDGRFTGRIERLCFGRHKVPIAEELAARLALDLDGSAFYSDSFNDLPMLSRVGQAVAVNPDARLRRHARRSGWRIEQWA